MGGGLMLYTAEGGYQTPATAPVARICEVVQGSGCEVASQPSDAWNQCEAFLMQAYDLVQQYKLMVA